MPILRGGGGSPTQETFGFIPSFDLLGDLIFSMRGRGMRINWVLYDWVLHLSIVDFEPFEQKLVMWKITDLLMIEDYRERKNK